MNTSNEHEILPNLKKLPVQSYTERHDSEQI